MIAPRFHFDRYVNGILMAEGVVIERAESVAEAMRKAASISSRGQHGEVPVLVLTSSVNIRLSVTLYTMKQ